MKNIIQIIKDASLEITDEQKKTIEDAVKENYKSVSDYDKQTRKVETLTQERDNFKTQYETAKETLDGFDGKDFDAITKERDEWKTKAENAEKEWKDNSNYDICINSDALGVEKSAELIYDLIEEKINTKEKAIHK